MGRLYQRQDAIESEKYAEIRITPLSVQRSID